MNIIPNLPYTIPISQSTTHGNSNTKFIDFVHVNVEATMFIKDF
jgi:hypothetical protein